MTHSLFGKLFGSSAAEARQQAQLLNAIGQLQRTIEDDQAPAAIELSGLDSPLREVAVAVNDVIALLSGKLEQSRNEIRLSLIHI